MTDSAVLIDGIGPPQWIEGHYFAAQFPKPPSPDGDLDIYLDTYRPVGDVEDALLLAHYEDVIRTLKTVEQDFDFSRVEQPVELPVTPPERPEPLSVGRWHDTDMSERSSRLRRRGRFIMVAAVAGMAASLTETPNAWKTVKRPLHPLIGHGQRLLESVWDKMGPNATYAAVGVGVLAIAVVGAKRWRRNCKTTAAESPDASYSHSEPIRDGFRQLS